MKESTNPSILLARLFVAGRNVKRSELVDMVRELLTLIEQPVDMPPARMIDELPPLKETRSPITVQTGPAGSVFLGPEANRYYTRSEAIALCGAISKVTQRKG